MRIKNLNDKLANELFPRNFYRINDERLATLTVRWVVIIFIISLCFPAVLMDDGYYPSILVWLIGAFETVFQMGELMHNVLSSHDLSKTLYQGIFNKDIFNFLSWYANPTIFISLCLLFTHKRLSMLFSCLSIILVLSFLFAGKYTGLDQETIRIISYQPGYWLWLLSSLVLLAGSALLVFRKKRDYEIIF